MKRILLLIVALSLLMLCACSSNGISQDKYDALQGEVESLREENESLRTENESLKTTIDSTETTTEPVKDSISEEETEQEIEQQESTIGTRKNPAKIGDSVSIQISSYSAQGNATITLTNVITGDEAWSMISNANMFNDAPSEGKEYILADFTVTFDKDTSGKDAPLEINKYDFDYATTDFSVHDIPSVVLPNPGFDLTIYEGATSHGWVAFLADVSEETPHAVFLDNIWFSLKQHFHNNDNPHAQKMPAPAATGTG